MSSVSTAVTGQPTSGGDGLAATAATPSASSVTVMVRATVWSTSVSSVPSSALESRTVTVSS